MNNLFTVILFLLVLVVAFSIVLLTYINSEKKKREKLKNSFKKFSEEHDSDKEELRSVKRVTIPDFMTITLTFTDEKYFGLKSKVIDLSQSGFAVKPDFPLRKLPVNEILNNVLVKTPINDFVIDKIKSIRYEHQIKKRVLGFEILALDKIQQEKQQQFMNYLDRYLSKID